MDATEYKARKGAVKAIRRSALDEILLLVHEQDPVLAALVDADLQLVVLDKPPEHTGQPDSDWVVVALAEDLAEAVLDCLGLAEAGAVGLDGETTAEASHAAGLVDTWQSWLRHYQAE